jgi:hypothetical protein
LSFGTRESGAFHHLTDEILERMTRYHDSVSSA